MFPPLLWVEVCSSGDCWVKCHPCTWECSAEFCSIFLLPYSLCFDFSCFTKCCWSHSFITKESFSGRQVLLSSFFLNWQLIIVQWTCDDYVIWDIHVEQHMQVNLQAWMLKHTTNPFSIWFMFLNCFSFSFSFSHGEICQWGVLLLLTADFKSPVKFSR